MKNERIDLFEKAIQDLESAKMEEVQTKVSKMIVVEYAITAGMAATLITLAFLAPSFVQSFLNVL